MSILAYVWVIFCCFFWFSFLVFISFLVVRLECVAVTDKSWLAREKTCLSAKDEIVAPYISNPARRDDHHDGDGDDDGFGFGY